MDSLDSTSPNLDNRKWLSGAAPFWPGFEFHADTAIILGLATWTTTAIVRCNIFWLRFPQPRTFKLGLISLDVRNLRSSFRIFWYPRIVQGAFASTTVRVPSLDGRKSCRCQGAALQPGEVWISWPVSTCFNQFWPSIFSGISFASCVPSVDSVDWIENEKPNYRAELVQTIQHANMEPTWSHGAGDAVPGDVVRLEELCSFCHVCPPAPLAFYLVCSPGCDGWFLVSFATGKNIWPHN